MPGSRSRDGLCEFEKRSVFALAKVLGLKEFGKRNEFSALFCRFAHMRDSTVHVLLRVW